MTGPGGRAIMTLRVPRFIEFMIIGLKAGCRKFPPLVGVGICMLLALALAGCSKRESAGVRPEATMQELNAALATWVMVKGLPQSVSELTNFPALKGKQLPASPVGKKLAIDAAKRQVIFVDDK